MTSASDHILAADAEEYPLIQNRKNGDTFAWHKGKAVSTDEFLRDVYALASKLPGNQYAFNLCEDRYWFLVSFAALLINRQTSLLPPNRAAHVISEIAGDYPEAFCICDTNQYELRLPVHHIDNISSDNAHKPGIPPLIPAQHLAAIAFTSGSTGIPCPNPKYWKDLVTGARMKQRRFGFGEGDKQQSIVATVPPQHMYGLETTVLNTLINGVSVYTDKTFFPVDICNALNTVTEPRILITTPVHMKSCVHSEIDWPKIDFIVSATAPLDKSLANLAESKFNCPVLEIYGCTEAGSLASRRTVTDDSWLLYEGSKLKQKAVGYYVAGPNLPNDILLQDIVKPVDSRNFVLLGRNTDMVNIAGKRSSLADLNIRLNRIDGVDDGVFIAPAPGDNTGTKLTALVVAPSLNPDEIRKKLSLMIDPVFLPRPLILLDKLPRNETGKLPRTALLEILDNLRNDN